jgi:hypothetical protein
MSSRIDCPRRTSVRRNQSRISSSLGGR